MASQSDLVPVLGIEKVSPEFKKKLINIADYLNIEPNYLTAIISFETQHTFSPAIKNIAGSDATGLIQFLPSTAEGLGTSVEELAKMSPEEQLDYVAKYFEPYKSRLNSLEDVYMAVLYPKAIGKDKDAVLFQQGTKEYTQNNGLDRNKDGSITVGEATREVRQILRHGLALQSVQQSQLQPSSLVQQQPSSTNQPIFEHKIIEPTLTVTAVADAAQTILDYKGTVTEDGQEFQGNTYSISDRNGILSLTKGDTEILRVDNGNITVNKVSDLDLMCLSRAAYEMNYGEYPAVSSPADVALTAITLANAAETVAKLDPNFLEGHDYDILLQGNNLRLEANGRGVILEV